MTREEFLRLSQSVYEDIKNMTQEDIEDFNNTVRAYKKEQRMTREEAIERLKNITNVSSMFIDEVVKDLVMVFQQPPTLLEILGWEDGEEYKWRGDIFRVQSDILQVWDREDEMWFDSSEELNDYLRLRQAKKVKPKYLLQTDLVSENGIQYLSFDKKRRKYFLGALMESDNVQQSFTDDEIRKINTITRFAKLCKKIEIE